MGPQAPSELTDRQISEEVSIYGISLSESQMQMVRLYIALLLKWNRSVSLTTVTSPADIVSRHFGESMFLSRLLPVENCRLADVGSGAGFPGLALKIACSSIHLALIESNKKKCAFLGEVVRSLELGDVEVRSERFEDIRPEVVSTNLITCRAIGGLQDLLHWAKGALAPRGHIALWLGGEDSARIARTRGWTWLPAARVPNSQRRFILIGRPLVESHAEK